MAQSRFVYVTYIRTTPEKLWQAPARSGIHQAVLVRNAAGKRLDPGLIVESLAPDGRIADDGKIVEYDPPRKLVLTWQNHLSPETEAEGHSRLTYEIESLAESVKLTLTHEMDRPDSKLIGAVSGGWPAILASLKSLLETGKPLVETTKWPEGV